MKKYTKPEMTVVKLRGRANLLSGSDPDKVHNKYSEYEQL